MIRYKKEAGIHKLLSYKSKKKGDMLMTRKTAAWLIACAALIIGLAVIMIAALAKDRKPSADTARFVIQNEFRAQGKDLTPLYFI